MTDPDLKNPLQSTDTQVGLAACAGIFAAVFCFLFFFYGNRFWFTLDEGIYIEGARQMLRGRRIYTDFFGFTSPCSYWLIELSFRVFGVSLRSARLVFYIEFSLQCALIFWLTSRFVSRFAAGATVFLFFVFQLSQPGLLTPHHWWDGVTFALMSISACLIGCQAGRQRWFIAAGTLASWAALCTPTLGLIVAVTLAWLCWGRERRRFLSSYAVSGLVVAAVVFGYMAATGLLPGFIEQAHWIRANYGRVNAAAYGALNGGYHEALAGASGIALIVRSLVLVTIALPAILPIAAVAGSLLDVVTAKKGEEQVEVPPNSAI